MMRRTMLSRATTALATLPILGRFFASVRTEPDPPTIFGTAIWDVALTDVEIAALGAGASPLHIRPQHLKEYLPPPPSKQFS